jgi:hypothetical protein
MGSPRPYPCAGHHIWVIGKITGYIYIGENCTVRENREKFPFSLGMAWAKQAYRGRIVLGGIAGKIILPAFCYVYVHFPYCFLTFY